MFCALQRSNPSIAPRGDAIANLASSSNARSPRFFSRNSRDAAEDERETDATASLAPALLGIL
jgi:hypothetical protein